MYLLRKNSNINGVLDFDQYSMPGLLPRQRLFEPLAALMGATRMHSGAPDSGTMQLTWTQLPRQHTRDLMDG